MEKVAVVFKVTCDLLYKNILVWKLGDAWNFLRSIRIYFFCKWRGNECFPWYINKKNYYMHIYLGCIDPMLTSLNKNVILHIAFSFIKLFFILLKWKIKLQKINDFKSFNAQNSFFPLLFKFLNG